MSKIKDFFLGLSKSTKITLISCVCFIILTLLILTFFVLFPITPSESTVSKISSEGLVYRDEVTTTTTTTSTTVTTTTTTTTTAVSTDTTTAQTETTAVAAQQEIYTTVDEYVWDENAPTDYVDYGDDYETNTAAPEEDIPQYTYDDNNYGEPADSTEYGDWSDWEDTTESVVPGNEPPAEQPAENATEAPESVQPATSPVIIQPSPDDAQNTTYDYDDVPYL
jgi:hypothetical protein